MSTDIEFLELVYTRLRTELRIVLQEWEGEFHALDVGMALGMLACEVGWDAGRTAEPEGTLMQKVKASLRILEDENG